MGSFKRWYKRLEHDPNWFTRDERHALAWSYIKWGFLAAAGSLIFLLCLLVWGLLTQ